MRNLLSHMTVRFRRNRKWVLEIIDQNNGNVRVSEQMPRKLFAIIK